jgi:cytochrome c peroxidase
MKILLFLALMLSSYAFAQSGHDYQNKASNDDHHGHNEVNGSDHKKLDKIILKQFFEPLPASIIDEKKNAALIKLGKKLYLDPRLSVNDQISCNFCHRLDNFGVDSQSTSPGHEGKRGGRNSPTTMNAALHIAQFWDGRAKDVEEQALGPIMNPIEMGMPSEAAVVDKLKKIEEYKDLFAEAFKDEKDPFQYKNVGKAIGAFERTLLTPSRFDDFLKGDEKALNDVEKRGLQKFIEIGCANCHNGVVIGGNSYKKIGLVEPYNTTDMGRFDITGLEIDRKVFKVPSLRNITKTGPYFHDGSVATLDDAIVEMAEHQLGREVDPEFVNDVKAFLGSLTSKGKE